MALPAYCLKHGPYIQLCYFPLLVPLCCGFCLPHSGSHRFNLEVERWTSWEAVSKKEVFWMQTMANGSGQTETLQCGPSRAVSQSPVSNPGSIWQEAGSFYHLVPICCCWRSATSDNAPVERRCVNLHTGMDGVSHAEALSLWHTHTHTPSPCCDWYIPISNQLKAAVSEMDWRGEI